MYEPCWECKLRYGFGYRKECDDRCEYANKVKSLKDQIAMVKPESTPIIDTEDGRLYQKTIWMRNEDEMRLNRLADRLDISKSDVIIAALKLYEEQMRAVEAEGFDVRCGRKPKSLQAIINNMSGSPGVPYFDMVEIEKLNQGLVKFGADVSEPIDPERLRELLEVIPEEI